MHSVVKMCPKSLERARLGSRKLSRIDNKNQKTFISHFHFFDFAKIGGNSV